TLLSRKQGFRRLLCDLLENGVVALGEQLRGIRRGRVRVSARIDGAREPAENGEIDHGCLQGARWSAVDLRGVLQHRIGCRPAPVLKTAEETTLTAGVAGDAAGLLDAQ